MGRMNIIEEEKKKGDDIRTQRTEDACHDQRTICVQNAECEPDTLAYIIVQNEINYEPEVSIIIPVYNAETYLQECLDSVINQNLRDIEIICIDDGSTDSSLSILREYAQKDTRISVLRQENLHAGVARNAGIAVARGKYIHFLDSDDWVDTNTYKKLVSFMDRLKVDVLKFRSFCFDNKKKSLVSTRFTDMDMLREEDFEKSYSLNRDYRLLIYVSDAPWSGIYSRIFLLEHNVRFNNLLCANDVSFFFRCLVHANKIYVTKERFVYYRINNPSSLIGIRARHFDCQIQLFFIILNIVRSCRLCIIKQIRKRLIDSIYYRYSSYIKNPNLEQDSKDKIRALIKDFNSHIQRHEIINGEYVTYYDDIQGRKQNSCTFKWRAYLNGILNCYKRCLLRGEFKSLCIKHIQNQLHQIRIDIKNFGTAENAIAIEAEGSTIAVPGWFCDALGRGQVLTSSVDKGKIKIDIISDGKLTISFLGPDMRFEGKRFPIWNDYKSIKIDGKEILSTHVSTWHDKPWRYAMPVKNKQKVYIEYERYPHFYSREELKDTILKLNPSSDVIRENIDALTDEITKIIIYAK